MRNVRNFWITLNVDGRKSTIKTGPHRKDGGFCIVIQMREKGTVSEDVVTVWGEMQPPGFSNGVGHGEILRLRVEGPHAGFSVKKER